MSYKFSAKAKTDLQNIYLYSLREFGELKADKFPQSLFSMCDIISQNPDMGLMPDFETHPDVRKFPSLGYVFYYLVNSDITEVRRITHGSREIDDFDLGIFQ